MNFPATAQTLARLQPAMEPIIIHPGKQEIAIIGRVTGTYREIG